MWKPDAILALFLPALFLTSQPVTAQEPTPETEDTFYDKIAVEIVNVEVYVTDKDGNPVTGLTRQDFIVTEDRRPVEIVNFYHVADGKAAIEDEAEVTAEVPEPPTAEPPGIPPARARQREVPDSQRLHLIVYVDNYNIHPLNRNRVFARIREFLRNTVEPGDEVLLASYDRSLHIDHPFTSDPSNVNRVLTELEGASASGNVRESERAEAVKAIYESTSIHAAHFRAKEFSDNWHHETHAALDALTEMVDSLAGLPGRKMLLHVSDGLPMIPGQDLYQAIQQRYADNSALGEALSRDMSRRYTQIITRANSNRTSFYTIDAGGLRTQSGMGAENAAVSSNYVVSSAVDGTKRNNLQSTLLMMANETGGQYVINTNNVGPGLERFARDFRNYYSLGYRAPAADRGRYHKIRVRLKNEERGWSLRHRDGYRDKSIDVQLADGVTSYLVHGYQRNPHGVVIDFGTQGPADADGFVDVAIRIRFPMEKIVLLPQGGFHVGRVMLYFGAADEKGRKAPLQEIPLELRIPEESLEMARRDEVTRVINATMRKGIQKLVVAVRDEISEERSVVGRSLRVLGSG